MRYISKAQRQLDGDLLLKPDTQALLHRTVRDLSDRLAADPDPDDDCLRALEAVREALGVFPGDDLPTVAEMLGDPRRERLARNLLKA
jgi:hypothetical protein